MYQTTIPRYLNYDLYLFVRNAFKDIKTKDDHNYFDHCMSVINFAINLADDYPTYNINLAKLAALALCHDVIEDLSEEVSYDLKVMLYYIFKTNEIYDELDNYLTYRKQTQSRDAYISNIANSNNIYVKLVKMADLIHNSLISRSKDNPPNLEKDISRITKYSKEFNQIKLSFSL